MRNLGLGRLGRLRFAEAEEVWMRPDASPTLEAGVIGLMLDTGTGRGDVDVAGSCICYCCV